jgi:hypothetical protein
VYKRMAVVGLVDLVDSVALIGLLRPLGLAVGRIADHCLEGRESGTLIRAILNIDGWLCLGCEVIIV